jgi:arabinofuranosyltransferase
MRPPTAPSAPPTQPVLGPGRWPRLARALGRRWPLALLLLGAALHILRLYGVTQGWVVDDAYISFRYAENWVDGLGLVFNPGQHVEGYTNFLWVVLLAIGYGLRLPTPGFAQVLGVVLTLGSVACAVAIGQHLLGRWSGVAVGALMAANHALMSWSFGGLELPLLLFLALLGTYLMHVKASPWSLLAFAGCAWTRPDGVLFLLVGLLFSWLPHGPLGGRPRRLGASLVALGLVAAHLGFKLAYYGSLLPNTFHAKVGFHFEQLSRGYEYLQAAAGHYLLLLPAVALLPFARGRASWRWYLLALLGAYGAFVVYAGGDPHPGWRLALPLLPFGWLGLGTLLSGWRRRAPWAALGLWTVLFLNDLWQALPGLPEGAAYGHFRTDRVAVCGQTIGRWLDRQAPPGAVIATNTGGSIPYFARRLEAIDMLGLTDATISQSNRSVGTGYVGHEAHDSSYVLARRPDYIFLCFSCNTSGPCMPSDVDLMADQRFTEGYVRHEARSQDLTFYYYTPRRPKRR